MSWKGSFTAKISGSTCAVVEEFKWIALSTTVWVVALCVPSVRDSYANGWRCLLRHASFWKLPGGFALAYGLFQLLDFLLLQWRIGRVPEFAPLIARMPLDYRQIALDSILPAAGVTGSRAKLSGGDISGFGCLRTPLSRQLSWSYW